MKNDRVGEQDKCNGNVIWRDKNSRGEEKNRWSC